jgi:hypothetical protein
MRTLAAPAAVGLAVVMASIGLPAASAQPAGSCGPAHTYIEAQTATVKSNAAVVVHGRSATLKCGGEDDSSYVTGKKVVLTLRGSATVKVWRVPEDPSQGTRTVPAQALPKWLKRNASEPIYKVNQSSNGKPQLVEQWHP